MAIRMQCKNCQYFDSAAGNSLCRREPPKSIAVPGAAPPVKLPGARPQIGFINWWPNVDPERDWCGHYIGNGQRTVSDADIDRVNLDAISAKLSADFKNKKN